jgi:hypothetical protein
MLLVSVAALALAGCAKKQNETATSSTNDSLIAGNPVEPPSGNLTPQTPFEPSPAPKSATPKPAPRPKRAAAPPSAREPAPETQPQASESPQPSRGAGLVVEWGTNLHVAFGDAISSETAHVGDEWSGTLADSVFVKDQLALPAGAVVHGTVTDARPAKAGDRASLTLQITSIDAGGKTYPMSATTEPLVAGSPRVRNISAVAGGAAAGALIGHAVGGGKGGLIGGLLGGAAAGGAVARSKGYESVIKAGATVTFTLSKDVVVRP